MGSQPVLLGFMDAAMGEGEGHYSINKVIYYKRKQIIDEQIDLKIYYSFLLFFLKFRLGATLTGQDQHRPVCQSVVSVVRLLYRY